MIDLTSPVAIYLDWYNNYLTLDKQLEHYQSWQATAEQADLLTKEWLLSMHKLGKAELNRQLGI